MPLVQQPTKSKHSQTPVDKVRRLIKRKTSEKTRLIKEIGDFEASMAPMAAVQQQLQSLDGEIHAQFEKALAKPKLGKRARRQIEDVYVELQNDGVISPDPKRLDDEACDCPFCQAEREAEAMFDDEPDLPFEEPPPRERAAAPKPAAKSQRDADVRALYHKLALRFHPDRAEDEARRGEHEAVMQQVNDAYHGGDTTRLLELSRELGIDLEGLKASDGVLAELVKQYKLVKAEVRALRHSMPGMLVVEARRAKREGFRPPLEVMQEEGEQAIEELTGLHDFVQSFAEGKISLKSFLEGPPGSSLGPDEMDGIDEEDLMMALTGMAEEVQDMLGVPPPPASRGGRGRGGQRKRR